LDPLQLGPPQLMADNMLGTLAKWLRVAGTDCEYADGMEDDDLVQVGLSGRLVLTRDKLLAQRCGEGGLYVASDVLEEQLLQVLRTMPSLLEGEPLSRCLACNVPVAVASPSGLRSSVPAGVLTSSGPVLDAGGPTGRAPMSRTCWTAWPSSGAGPGSNHSPGWSLENGVPRSLRPQRIMPFLPQVGHSMGVGLSVVYTGTMLLQAGHRTLDMGSAAGAGAGA